MRIEQRYRERRIRRLENWSVNGWRMKLYGISVGGAGPDAGLVDVGRRLAAGVLPTPPRTATRYGAGFMGVHQGADSNLVFVDWWAFDNELYHHAWAGPAHGGASLEYVTPHGLLACVWDLAVLAFERQAWIDCVLAARTPDIERYLRTGLDGWI